MSGLLFRTRAAVLWVAVAIATSISLLLLLFVPGALEDLVAGEIEGEAVTDARGYVFAAVGTVPLVMAGASLLVSDRVNRYVNLIAGAAFGLFGFYAAVSHTLAGDLNAHTAMMALAGALAFVIAGLGLAELRRPLSPGIAQSTERIRHREEARV